MRLTGEQLPLGRSGRRSNPRRLLALTALILGGVVLYRLIDVGRVQPLFVGGPPPTRSADSFAIEGQAYFSAGDLQKAITAYQSAAKVQPDDAQLLAELARIQTYFSGLQPNAAKRGQLLGDARAVIDQAVKASPDDGKAQAIRALVYDWSASSEVGEAHDRYLTEARNAAVRALQLETSGALHNLALAFSAEVLVDQQQYAEATDKAAQAAAQAPDDFDVHRVYGTVLQSTGLYRQSIEEFQRAAEINPNLTFLYIQIGANYRRLRDIPHALEAFDRAVRINQQLGIQDPTPYFSIGKTYFQDGEFFIAAKNVERALVIDEGNAEYYGFLGTVYYKARNYESAVEVLRCAVEGCTAEESRNLICSLILGCNPSDPKDAVAPLHGQVVAGLPLEQRYVEIYYTYNSVLAFNGNCDTASQIGQRLMAAFGGDPIVAGIVADNRDLCSRPRSTPAASTSTPASVK